MGLVKVPVARKGRVMIRVTEAFISRFTAEWAAQGLPNNRGCGYFVAGNILQAWG